MKDLNAWCVKVLRGVYPWEDLPYLRITYIFIFVNDIFLFCYTVGGIFSFVFIFHIWVEVKFGLR